MARGLPVTFPIHNSEKWKKRGIQKPLGLGLDTRPMVCPRPTQKWNASVATAGMLMNVDEVLTQLFALYLLCMTKYLAD